MPLRIIVTKKESGIFIVSLVGSIDSETCMNLDKEIGKVLDSSPKGIIFNMEGVNYISSLGLSIMFRIKKAVEKIGGTLIMTGIQPKIKKVFDAVKFIPDHIFENMAEANKHFDDFLAYVQREETEEPDAFPFTEYRNA
ncbi:MAG: STAS domain-containing protein [Candidatus Omnitrophota bacterium]|nr:MAG: STAS domain-containing protein [Candidatus Omnitrophota bacterium]